MIREDITGIIYEAIGRTNELREPAHRLICTEETVLYGEGGGLDSLGLVSLILDVEEVLNGRTGGQLVLADERAVAMRRNPFRDVRSFSDYVMTRLEGEETCQPPPSS